MHNSTAYLYGKFAVGSRRELERFARSKGFAIANALRESLDYVVLGEGESLLRTREKLAREFDENSRDAFESGALRVLTESEFIALLTDDDETPKLGATPAVVAELVGVSVDSVRRWIRKGLLRPVYERERLPLLPAREIVVARRLAFLRSTNLGEDFLESRARRFAEMESSSDRKDSVDVNAAKAAPYLPGDDDEDRPLFQAFDRDGNFARTTETNDESRDETLDLGAFILRMTLSDDGRDALFFRDGTDAPPVDSRGQRRFSFAVAPTSGAYEPPPEREPLSPDEESIALAERLRKWNETATNATSRPAFLALFAGEADSATGITVEGDDANAEVFRPENADLSVYKRVDVESSGIEGSATSELLGEARRLERGGYWEEAARAYRRVARMEGASADIDFRLGKLLYLLGEFGAARERFSGALEESPTFAGAKLELGRALVALQEYDEALETFEDALKEDQDDPSLLLELGKLHLILDRREDAEREFNRAIEKIDDPQLAADVRKFAKALAGS